MLLHDRKKAAAALQSLYEAMCPYPEFDTVMEFFLDPVKDELVNKGYIDDDCQPTE